MANISQNVNIEMLEKLPDGTYKRKYPKTRSDTGVTFDEHLADDVSQGEIHGLKVVNGKLNFFNGTDWSVLDSKEYTVVDVSGSPGSMLGVGTIQEGFFGEVPASELFTASEIASACGISQGTAQFENEPWLKFAIDGKIIFKPRKAIRHTISWNSINAANCVYGGSEGKRVTKNGQTYIVRLMKGALTDPSLYDAADRGAKGSEWNRLMLPIHEQAIDKSWAYSAYVEDNAPIWSHNFGTGANGMYTDADLMTRTNHGNGSYTWCQETSNADAARRVFRGGNGVSQSTTNAASGTTSNFGWSPVLELIS